MDIEGIEQRLDGLKETSCLSVQPMRRPFTLRIHSLVGGRRVWETDDGEEEWTALIACTYQCCIITEGIGPTWNVCTSILVSPSQNILNGIDNSCSSSC
jgi:hypothetical protein